VTVLDQRDGALRQIGQVGGLGQGERIFAVRFIGPAGYVVTFRQVDPLYVVDLERPAQPVVRGELKIRGYSAYLHPVGPGLLLGVGQDATDAGAQLGTQLSLFDVSDPSNPRRLHQAAVAGASSQAEFDHHAFLWWAPRDLAVVPLNVFDAGPSSRAASSSRAQRASGRTGRPGSPRSAAHCTRTRRSSAPSCWAAGCSRSRTRASRRTRSTTSPSTAGWHSRRRRPSRAVHSFQYRPPGPP
jgi:Beta propeller domain